VLVGVSIPIAPVEISMDFLPKFLAVPPKLKVDLLYVDCSSPTIVYLPRRKEMSAPNRL
jgi:hypothetical protein